MKRITFEFRFIKKNVYPVIELNANLLEDGSIDVQASVIKDLNTIIPIDNEYAIKYIKFFIKGIPDYVHFINEQTVIFVKNKSISDLIDSNQEMTNLNKVMEEIYLKSI